MEFLLSHCHCILPIVFLAIGAFFMNRDKPKKRSGIKNHSENYDEYFQYPS